LCFPEFENAAFSLLDEKLSKVEFHVDVGFIREAAFPRGVRLIGMGCRTLSPELLEEETNRMREPPPSIDDRRRSDFEDDDMTQDISLSHGFLQP
jgi:hypothetical protein